MSPAWIQVGCRCSCSFPLASALTRAPLALWSLWQASQCRPTGTPRVRRLGSARAASLVRATTLRAGLENGASSRGHSLRHHERTDGAFREDLMPYVEQ
jgi:hypothetical protein